MPEKTPRNYQDVSDESSVRHGERLPFPLGASCIGVLAMLLARALFGRIDLGESLLRVRLHLGIKVQLVREGLRATLPRRPIGSVDVSCLYTSNLHSHTDASAGKQKKNSD